VQDKLIMDQQLSTASNFQQNLHQHSSPVFSAMKGEESIL